MGNSSSKASHVDVGDEQNEENSVDVEWKYKTPRHRQNGGKSRIISATNKSERDPLLPQENESKDETHRRVTPIKLEVSNSI